MNEIPSSSIPGRALPPAPSVGSSLPVIEPSYPRYGSPQPPVDDHDGGIIEYWRILRRRKGTVIMLAFLGLAVGLLATIPQTPIYQARASVEVQNLNENFLNMNQVSQVAESTNYNALFDIQTQIRILQSETLLDRVVDRLKNTSVAQASTPAPPSRINSWRSALNLPAPDRTADPRTESLRTIAKDIKVRNAGQTRIVEILTESPDPGIASEFANTLIQEFIDQNMEARWKMTQRTGEWLTRQLDDMRVKLERSDDSLQAYARRAGILMTGGDGKENVVESKLRQVQEELSRAQADRVTKQSRYETAQSATPDALADVLNDTSLRSYEERLTDLRRQQAELATTYTPEHSKMQRLVAQIQSLTRALERERAMILGRIKNDYDEAVRREDLLKGAYVAQAHIVTDQAEKGIQYNILKREVDTNRQLYESMLQRVRESSVASAMRASSIRVVDNAKLPKKPFRPSYPINASLGLLSGVVFGLAFVITSERANRTLREPGDASFYLGVAELGHIPSAIEKRSRIYGYISKGGQSQERGMIEASMVDVPDVPELVTYRRRSSPAAEAFRAILTSILFSSQKGQRPRVLVVTSGNPREGKTTVATNLALALAEVNQRVVIVDGDLRKPRISYAFSIPDGEGLTTLLQNREFDPDRLDSLIRPAQIPNLSVLPSGPSTNAAANLLYSPVLGQILNHLRDKFDTVIIDTPPMLQMPDARIVGNLVDGVILVTRGGVTTKDAGLAACDRLRHDGVPLLGVVLNDWDPSNAPNGFYGYYKSYNAYYKSGYYTASGQETAPKV
ncbi:MAG: polysaccharide biosynthesis tyrosine autokinase [Bryobacteraceae bacterium]